MYKVLKTRNMIYVYDKNEHMPNMPKKSHVKTAKDEEQALSIIRRYGIHSYFEQFMEKIKEILGEEMPAYVISGMRKNLVDYISRNHMYRIVEKTSSEQKVEGETVFVSRKYILVDEGVINPLEFNKVKDFMKSPSKDILEGSDGYPRTILDVITDGIHIDYDTAAGIFMDAAGHGSFNSYFVKTDCFKNRYASIFDSICKACLYENRKISNQDFYSFYRSACKECGIEPENVEYLGECNPVFQKKIYDAILPFKDDLYRNMDVTRNRGKDPLGYKKVFLQVKDRPVPKSSMHIRKRLKQLRELLEKCLVHVTCHPVKGNNEDDISDDILWEISGIEALGYEYNEVRIELSKMLESEECRRDLALKGMDYVIEYTYVNMDTKRRILDMIPESPEKEYPDARYMNRHFILHCGPTNSGKTYQAIEALKAAKSGVYLGPLRLLALEIQDTLMQSGVPCSLLTGEEEDIICDSYHMASTVEKLDTTKRYEVCVIDEAQMISDPERGFAWTRAILGVLSDTIHVCMAPEAMNIVIKLIELCGDTYEVQKHNRRSELIFQGKVLLNADTVEQGDAYIVFSKRKVLQVAADLVKQGVKVSMIYGNLPYSVRKEQVKRFINGDTDVVVSTNAIGMGINLPVRRIVFLEDKRFNGVEVAPLSTEDVKQIAGRAGRNEETGYVATILDNGEMIESLLNSRVCDIQKAYLGFSDTIISIDAPLPDILRVWRTINTPDMFTKMDIDRYIAMDESVYVDVTKKQKLKMISIPFDERNEILFEQWKGYCFAFEKGDVQLARPSLQGEDLQNLEDYYQGLDLWYSFSKNFGYEIDMEWLRKEKSDISEKIDEVLVKDTVLFQKKCMCCGRPMHWSNPYKTCFNCFKRAGHVKTS